MTNGDGNEARRRSGKLWKVLVVGGMTLAAGCAGNQKSGDKGSSSTGSSSSDTGATGADTSHGGGGSGGGGAGGW